MSETRKQFVDVKGLKMKLSKICLPVGIALLATVNAGVSYAASDAVKIANYARVTDNHKILHRLKGTWRGKGTLVSTEGGAAEKILCKAKYKLILGGRFVEQNTTCKGAGYTFNGVGHFGYDTLYKKYVGSTMSDADSGIATLNGKRSKNTINFTLTHNNVLSRTRVNSRAVLKIGKKSEHSYSIFAKGKDGKERAIFNVVYKK